MAEGIKERVAALEAPSISVDALAAQMDLAEKVDLAPVTPQRNTLSTRISY